jgi:universal stress protein E
MKPPRWKSIVVVVNDPFVREQPALAKAVAIAKRCKARLTLFNSFMVPQPVSDVPMDSRKQIIASAIRQRIERLEQLTAARRLRGVKHVVQWDFPASEAIVREVLRSKADLVVTDSHRRGRFARLVLANTDWELMRTCPCPVWFVRSEELPEPLQILVAVDPRHTHAKPARLDDRLLQAAIALGGRISVVHAYETPASAVPGMLMEPIRLPLSPERTREFVANTVRLVGQLCSRYGVSSTDCAVEEGNARDVIAAVARRRSADLVVMGAVSRSLLKRPVIGSTAESVIDHIGCDVLVVKPAKFKTPVRRARVRA